MENISLLKALWILSERRQLPTEWQKVFDLNRRANQINGVPFDGGQISLRWNTRIDDTMDTALEHDTPGFVENRSGAIVAGGTTTGGYAVQTDKRTVLPPLTNYLVLTKAGATYLEGLVGSVSIPTYSGTTVNWATETAAASDGSGTWGKVDLSPKRMTAYIDVSRMFLNQDSVGAENMLLENIVMKVAEKLEATILGIGEGDTVSTPQGLFWPTYTAGATSLSWSSVVALETTVDSSNAAVQNLAYITNAKGRGMAKTTNVTSTYGDRMLMDLNGQINGYPVYVSNGVPKLTDFSTTTGTGFIFGNWKDLIIGNWGGLDITIDPYSQAINGNVRLTLNTFFDAKVARSESFAPKHMV